MGLDTVSWLAKKTASAIFSQDLAEGDRTDMHAMARCAATAALATLMTTPIFAQSDGDIPGDVIDESGTAYSAEEIIAEVGEVFGQAAANELAASGVGFVELGSPTGGKIGDHDSGDIGIDTKTAEGDVQLSVTETAVIAHHEFKHVKNALAAGKPFDPTDDGPLGTCVHAQIHEDTAMDAMIHAVGYAGVEVCFMCQQALRKAEEYIAVCRKNGGTPPDLNDGWAAFYDVCSL